MTVPATSLAPYSVIAETIARRLAESRAGDPLGLWPEEVLVASSGMAQAISRALLERFPAGIAGLQLQSIETLARRIVNAAGEYPRVATDIERRLAMRTAARTIDDPLTASRGAGAMLERSYRDMRDSGLTLAEFAQRVRRAKNLRNADRIRLLVDVWQTYERMVAKLGAIDAADLLGRAAALAQTAGVAPQIVAGFYDMTGAQLSFIDALKGAGRLQAIYIPVEPAEPDAYAFAKPFLTRFGANAAASSSPPLKREWSIRQATTREAEIEAVCESIRALLDEGVAPYAIGAVVRTLDPYDTHLFNRFARAYGFASTAAEEQSLAAHRFGRALVLLLRIRDRNFPRAEVLEIARSGLHLETRMAADKADSETRRCQIAGGASAALRERRLESPVIADYIQTVAELEELTARIDVRAIHEIIERFRPSTDADFDALAALQQIVDVFRRAESWKRPFDANALIDAIESTSIDRPQRSGGDGEPVIWRGDVMTFRGRSFEHLFAMRMQDDVLPQRRVEDPLLVDADRRLLGVREIGDGRAEEQLLFRLMCSGGRITHFSVATSDGFGKVLRPSQLLKQFAIEQKPDQRAGILKNRLAGLGTFDETEGRKATREIRQPDARALQLIVRAGTAGPFDGYVRAAAILERAAAVLQSVSPTQLEDFGECPQKFFLKHILGVRDLEDPEMELQINPRDKGTLDHSILESFYRATRPEEIFEAARSLPLLPQTIVERLERAVEEGFDRFDKDLPPFNLPMRRIERRATRRTLRHFIAGDIGDLARRGLAPERYEYRFGSKHRKRGFEPDHEEAFVIEIRGVPLRVEGTIDRVDTGFGESSTQTQRFRIVDYKSGKAARHKNLGEKIDRGVRLQLPLYAMAVADFFGAAAENVSGAIKPLAGDVKSADYEFELAEKRDRLRETLDIFVAAILRGDFPAFPNDTDRENDFNSCKYCPVNHSCRTRYDADESRAALSAGDPRTLLSQEPH